MLVKKCTAILLASVMLANCATASGEGEGGICQREFAACVIGGVVLLAGAAVIGLAIAYDGGASDNRLKRDIEHVDTLPNGMKLYSFRYWNDDRTFISVMAQDLLEDERFRHSVNEDESGYYMVNFAALGLGIVGDAEQFLEAGRAALAEAQPVVK